MMLAYVMNKDLQIEIVCDDFTSLIWTERFDEVGDFEVQFPISLYRKYRGLVNGKKFFRISESHRVMLIEREDMSVNNDGEWTFKLSGRSLEAAFGHRVIYDKSKYRNWDPSEGPTPKEDLMWHAEGDSDRVIQMTMVRLLNADTPITENYPRYATPDQYIENLKVLGFTDNSDDYIYPRYGEVDPIKNEFIDDYFEEMTLLEFMNRICQEYGFGYRAYQPEWFSSNIHFSIYTGIDRTKYVPSGPFGEDGHQPLIFSAATGSFQSYEEYYDISDKATHGILLESRQTQEAVIARGGSYDPTISDWHKKFQYRDLTEWRGWTPNGPSQYENSVLQEIGREHNTLSGVEGRLVTFSKQSFVYDKDYFVGDFVWVENRAGDLQRMRIQEQVFSWSADEGIQIYPTFSVDPRISFDD